uniref:ER membrane protein complex subunit 2 n=1 Tax=Acrobeloides nanus TaxID=290746 RepID=A0A914CFB7_9BILA
MVDIQDWTEISYEEARSTLRKWREEHARRSEETVEIWEHVLSRYASSLKDELWPVLEQVAISSLDSARYELAIECLMHLNKRFPKSTRVTKLQAMRLEALRDFKNAELLYEKLIKTDESNTFYRKRKIAMLIAQGERHEAIRQLNDYLETFINDPEAWLELSELYLQEADYARAAFCFEELLLANPQNSLYLRRIAEIRYTLGGTENVELARAYYEHAVKCNNSDARALYGVILCCNYLLPKATAQRKKELGATGFKAADRLIAVYEEQPNENPSLKFQIKTIQTLKNIIKNATA